MPQSTQPALRYPRLCRQRYVIACQSKQIVLHLGLHFIVPAAFAFLFFRRNWKVAWLLITMTMLVDLDHLLATPVYDAGRCSIGFHPLHQLWFIALYFALCFFPKIRLVGIGLVLHMALDSIDCQTTNGVWITMESGSPFANVLDWR